MNIKQLLLIGIGSISFMASCSCSNNDQIFLDKLNAVLKEHAKQINTCYDAIKTVEAAGIEINDYPVKDNQEFVYDSIAKQFVMMIGDEIIKTTGDYKKRDNKYDYFKSVFVYNPNLEYSQYLDKRASVPSDLVITTGFDIGDHKDIPNITYTNLSSKSKDVIIRTYSDYFTILAPNDIIHHYEIANNIIVTDVGTLDSHAVSAYTKGVSGFINFSNGSSTDIFEVVNGAEEDVSVELEGDAKVYSVVNIDKTKSGKTFDAKLECVNVHSKEELENAISKTQLVRLTSDLTYDNEALVFPESTVLDLNGYKLTFNGDGSSDAIVIENVSVYLMDSQGVLDDNSGIVLNDCNIEVKSKATDEITNLIINGGKITFYCLDSLYPYAIRALGNTNKDNDDIYPANILVYGGKLDAFGLDGSNASIFTASGKGASISVSYLNGFAETSIFHLKSGRGYSPIRSSIYVYGGNFKSNNYIFDNCIENTIVVDGGIYNCERFMRASNGNVSIKNATIINGEHNSDLSKSAIEIEKNYSININIDIVNTYINSIYGYIFEVETNIIQESVININFGEGTYHYFLGNGLNYAESDNVHISISDKANFIKHKYA